MNGDLAALIGGLVLLVVWVRLAVMSASGFSLSTLMEKSPAEANRELRRRIFLAWTALVVFSIDTAALVLATSGYFT